MNFIHSGQSGDIVFSLPTIREMGGGDLYIVDFDRQRSESIAKLVEVQSYIGKVVIGERPESYVDLNKFREYASHHVNLIKSHFMGAGIPVDHSYKEGWLTLPENADIKIPDGSYSVINRTERYIDPNFDWKKEVEYLKTISDKVYFIGYRPEFEEFCTKFCDVEYYDCDFLEGAYLIDRAVMFTGCYSAFQAIAMGLGREYRLQQAPNHTCSSLLEKRETILNV